MTVAVLTGGWILLAGLVSPPGARLVWRFAPRLQVFVLGAVIAGLVLVPASLIAITLSNALAGLGGSGSVLDRCGTLIAALVDKPLAHPEVTLSLVLLAAAIGGIIGGAVRAWRSQRSSRRMARAEAGEFVVAESDEDFAFTAGLLRPRVVVSRAFLDHTPAEWRQVVLAHEEAHRRGRHPLLVFAAETLARGLPLLPLRWASDQLRLSLEAVADEAATQEIDDAALVAEAIGGMALSPAAGSVAFEGNEVTRVRRLLAAPPALRPIVGVVLIATTFIVIGFAGAHAAHCGDASLRSFQVTQCRLPH